jgi:hypothetical protein
MTTAEVHAVLSEVKAKMQRIQDKPNRLFTDADIESMLTGLKATAPVRLVVGPVPMER